MKKNDKKLIYGLSIRLVVVHDSTPYALNTLFFEFEDVSNESSLALYKLELFFPVEVITLL